MKIIYGDKDFFGSPFPVVLGDRYVRVYENEIGLTLDVFRWDAAKKDGVYEILRGRPQAAADANVKLDMKGGKFVLDVWTWSVQISDHDLELQKDGKTVQTLARDQFLTNMIGLQVGTDGAITSGVDKLPEGLEVERNLR